LRFSWRWHMAGMLVRIERSRAKGSHGQEISGVCGSASGFASGNG
jgi:hypothetical protein